MRFTLALACAMCLSATLCASATAQSAAATLAPAVRPGATGEEIDRAACATCHGLDGTGSPSSVVGFALPLGNGHGFPDFTDCASNTGEPRSTGWPSRTGRPVRALDRHMPAFGDALSAERHRPRRRPRAHVLRRRPWPRGDLNFPRSFFTEKAFPENEAVFSTGSRPGGRARCENKLVYERRFGSRNSYEMIVPFALAEGEAGAWPARHRRRRLRLAQTLLPQYERGTHPRVRRAR